MPRGLEVEPDLICVNLRGTLDSFVFGVPHAWPRSVPLQVAWSGAAGRGQVASQQRVLDAWPLHADFLLSEV